MHEGEEKTFKTFIDDLIKKLGDSDSSCSETSFDNSFLAARNSDDDLLSDILSQFSGLFQSDIVAIYAKDSRIHRVEKQLEAMRVLNLMGGEQLRQKGRRKNPVSGNPKKNSDFLEMIALEEIVQKRWINKWIKRLWFLSQIFRRCGQKRTGFTWMKTVFTTEMFSLSLQPTNLHKLSVNSRSALMCDASILVHLEAFFFWVFVAMVKAGNICLVSCCKLFKLWVFGVLVTPSLVATVFRRRGATLSVRDCLCCCAHLEMETQTQTCENESLHPSPLTISCPDTFVPLFEQFFETVVFFNSCRADLFLSDLFQSASCRPKSLGLSSCCAEQVFLVETFFLSFWESCRNVKFQVFVAPDSGATISRFIDSAPVASYSSLCACWFRVDTMLKVLKQFILCCSLTDKGWKYINNEKRRKQLSVFSNCHPWIKTCKRTQSSIRDSWNETWKWKTWDLPIPENRTRTHMAGKLFNSVQIVEVEMIQKSSTPSEAESSSLSQTKRVAFGAVGTRWILLDRETSQLSLSTPSLPSRKVQPDHASPCRPTDRLSMKPFGSWLTQRMALGKGPSCSRLQDWWNFSSGSCRSCWSSPSWSP